MYNIRIFGSVLTWTFTIFGLATSALALDEVKPGFYINSVGSPLIKLVDQAKHTIDIEIYEMFNLKFRQALQRALQRGVTVRIVHEPLPYNTDCPLFQPPGPKEKKECTELRNLTKEIETKGGRFVPFQKLNLCANLQERDFSSPGGPVCFQHGKLLLVDHEFALISTGNFNDSNLCDTDDLSDRCNRDYSVVTDDTDVVSALGQIFEKDLVGSPYQVEEILTPNVAAKLTVSPISLDAIVQFIHSATKSIRIQNQYLKEFTVNRALIAAARRGVQVKVNVASFCSFERPDDYVREQTSKTYKLFDEVGIQTRIFTRRMTINGHPGYLHAKAIVVDDTRAWVGSINGSVPALIKNREFGLFLRNPESVASLTTAMDDDMANPESETWQESLNCLKDAR